MNQEILDLIKITVEDIMKRNHHPCSELEDFFKAIEYFEGEIECVRFYNWGYSSGGKELAWVSWEEYVTENMLNIMMQSNYSYEKINPNLSVYSVEFILWYRRNGGHYS